MKHFQFLAGCLEISGSAGQSLPRWWLLFLHGQPRVANSALFQSCAFGQFLHWSTTWEIWKLASCFSFLSSKSRGKNLLNLFGENKGLGGRQRLDPYMSIGRWKRGINWWWYWWVISSLLAIFLRTFLDYEPCSCMAGSEGEFRWNAISLSSRQNCKRFKKEEERLQGHKVLWHLQEGLSHLKHTISHMGKVCFTATKEIATFSDSDRERSNSS